MAVLIDELFEIYSPGNIVTVLQLFVKQFAGSLHSIFPSAFVVKPLHSLPSFPVELPNKHKSNTSFFSVPVTFTEVDDVSVLDWILVEVAVVVVVGVVVTV